MRTINTLVIHHTGAPATQTPEEIRAFHRKKFGYPAYHELITPGGVIAKGREHSLKGAGVWGMNTGKLHVALIGNFAEKDKGYTGAPPVAQVDALGHWLRVNTERYDIAWQNVVGHKEIALVGHFTLCPGDIDLQGIRLWVKGGCQDSLYKFLEERER